MKRLILLLALVGAGTERRLPAGEPTSSESLCNGADLRGWVVMNGGQFCVTNGVIRVVGGKGWLRTEREFTNFVLEAEWRGLETNYNSGIFLRAPLEGNPWATNAWQINLKQTAIGELLEGSQKVVAATAKPRPAGEWIKFRIEVRGRRVSLAVDEQAAWIFEDLSPAKGFLGLQAEGKAVEFRNLRVSP